MKNSNELKYITSVVIQQQITTYRKTIISDAEKLIPNDQSYIVT